MKLKTVLCSLGLLALSLSMAPLAPAFVRHNPGTVSTGSGSTSPDYVKHNHDYFTQLMQAIAKMFGQ